MTAADYARLETLLGSDPDWAACVACISDVRGVVAMITSTTELSRLAEGRPQRVDIADKRIAYLANPGAQAGMVLRYIELSGTQSVAAVFHSEQDAYAWLGLAP